MSVLLKAAGISNSSGDAPNVEDVFSTYLYEGTGSSQTITNGIDLDGEGGMVWFKTRNTASVHHEIIDTERGGTKVLYTSRTQAEDTMSSGNGITAFNSNGYTRSVTNETNLNGYDDVSWTFRKAPRFFDVVTYTGNGTAGREIAHDLGVAPGMIIVKRTNVSGDDWAVYHRSLGSTKYIALNLTDSSYANTAWNNTAPTATKFTVNNFGYINASGNTYVAYLFAHDPDGENDDGMIACGSYTGNGSTTGPVIDLGWEPQYILLKVSSHIDNWMIYDTMRGWTADGGNAELRPHSSSAEASPLDFIALNSTGFQPVSSNQQFNGSSRTYIYMAIRSPMMVEPEAGSEVFAVDNGGNSGSSTVFAYTAGFPVDMSIHTRTEANQNRYQSSRLMGGKYLLTTSTAVETSNASWTFDSNTQYFNDYAADTSYAYMFKRAKGFFDVVAYTGNGTAGRTVNHSLGVAPEMMWLKCRSFTGRSWMVYLDSFGSDYEMLVDNSSGMASSAGSWNSTTPTSTEFTVSSSWQVNKSAEGYIALLFATLDGISKVGSYTGNGSNQDIACGFSAGARFVLIKRTDSSGDWYIWDTTRGIVAGNDPHLSLNTTSAEVTTDDSIDPQSAGFTVNQVSATNINVSSATYIFLAIA